jgi:hypothetical protein
MPVFSTSDELVVPMSRLKLVALALGAALFVVGGAWLISLAGTLGPFVMEVGVAAIVFFGACGVYALYRIARPRPALVVSPRGILDNSSAISVGFIAWDDVAALREYRFNDQVFLGIVPKNLDAILARQPAWKRAAIRANLGLGADPVNIPQVVLPMSVSQLLQEIEMRFGRKPRG